MKIRTPVLILGLAGFTVTADAWLAFPILPAIADGFNEGMSRSGLLIAAYMIPFGLFQIVFGHMVIRYGKPELLSVFMLLFATAAFLCAIAENMTQLTVYRALTGIFAAPVIPASMAFIGNLEPVEQRRQAAGFYIGISLSGQGLSMAIGGITAHFLDWRFVFAIYAAELSHLPVDSPSFF